MEISAVEFTKEQAEYIFPPTVRGLLLEFGAHTFVAMEDDDIYAVALTTPNASDDKKCIIQYIAKLSNGQDEHVCMLIEYIENICQEYGMTDLTCRLVDNADSLSGIDNFMTYNGYDATMTNGHMLMYQLKDIEDTLFHEKLPEMKRLTDLVKCYNELGLRQISQFAEKMKEATGETFELPDLVFGRFFVIGNEIKGYMDLSEVIDGVLFAKRQFIMKSEETKFALPAMMASAITVSEALMNGETYVYIQLKSEFIYNNIIRVFGNAQSDLAIYEYSKKL